MAFVAKSAKEYLGTVVGDGHCVAYVRAAALAPHTSAWVQGNAVWDTADIKPGTAIATFNQHGVYANTTDGSSHTAIYLDTNEAGGILVIDQWVGQPVHQRTIRPKGGQGPACDDADAYAVIETA